MTLNKSKIVNIDEHPKEAVTAAQKIFYEGGVFIYPTDTIYGFGANPFNQDAVDRIFEIKKRPAEKSMIMLAGSIDVILKMVEFKSENLIDFLLSVWPNPISVVLRLNRVTSEQLNMDTAAFRIPHHSFCQKLLNEIKMPLISTSVNRHGQEPLKDYTQIKMEFNGEVNGIFHTKRATLNTGSTVIKLTSGKPELIREGKIQFSEIMQKFELRT